MPFIANTRILVVEDDQIMGPEIVRRLERFGYEASFAVNYDELESALTRDHDLILTEPWLVDRQDILELVGRVSKERGIPFIVLSANFDEAFLDRVIASGAWKIILKPFKERELHTSIELALVASRTKDSFTCGLESGGEGILIIEDEKIIALDMQRRLEKFGFKVVGIAPSVEEGLVLAERNSPGLVSTGITLMGGDKDGIEGARIIRNRWAIPLIYVTAFADEETLERVAETTPDDYILKPFKERELYCAIRMAIARHAHKDPTTAVYDIFAAARRGGAAELATALSCGAGPNIRDPGGKTPLMYAARYNDRPEVVVVLLGAGAEINAADEERRTALMYALTGRQPSILEALLARGAAVSLRDAEGWGMLDYWWSGRSGPAALSALYRAGLDAGTRLSGGRRLFAALIAHRTYRADEKVCLWTVLREAEYPLDWSDIADTAPATLAAVASVSERMLGALLAKGVDINDASEGTATALQIAATSGDEYAVQRLLALGATQEANGENAMSPLAALWQDSGHWLQEGRRLASKSRIAVTLVEAGGRIERAILGEPTQVGIAIFAEAFPESLAGLVTLDEVRATDNSSRTALGYAAADLGPRSVDCLLALGADPLGKSRWRGYVIPHESALTNPTLAGSAALERLRIATEEAERN